MMKIEYMIKAMMIAQYLEMIDKTEKRLEILHDGLSALICPEVYKNACDECRADETADRLNLN